MPTAQQRPRATEPIDAAPAAVDQPEVMRGSWVSDGGVVLEADDRVGGRRGRWAGGDPAGGPLESFRSPGPADIHACCDPPALTSGRRFAPHLGRAAQVWDGPVP